MVSQVMDRGIEVRRRLSAIRRLTVLTSSFTTPPGSFHTQPCSILACVTRDCIPRRREAPPKTTDAGEDGDNGISLYSFLRHVSAEPSLVNT